MNIGIDGTVLNQTYQSGQKRCLENLIISLARIDNQNNYYIFTRNKIKIVNKPNFRAILLPRWLPILKRQIAIPIISYFKKIEIFYFPDVWGSIVAPAKVTVVTFHDLAPPSSYPVWYKSGKFFLMQTINYFTRIFTLKNATKIILVTNSIKNEYQKKYGYDKRLAVVKQAIPENFKISKPLFNKSKYFIAFADFSPRKNIDGVLHAFSIFKNYKKEFSAFRLKIVVSTKLPKANIFAVARKLGVEKNIDLLIGISNSQLVSIYKKSAALIYPSFYEGFGFPVIEAFACGCPVITTNYGATKETSSGSAILINPRSPKSIFKGMLVVATNKKVVKQNILSGIKVSKSLSWNSTAVNTLNIFKKAYEEAYRKKQ